MIRRKKRLRRKAPRSFRPKPLAQDCPKSSGFFFVRAARAVRYFSCFAPVWPLARDCPKSSGFFFVRAARAVRYFSCFAPVWPLARDCPKSSGFFFCARGAGCPLFFMLCPGLAACPGLPEIKRFFFARAARAVRPPRPSNRTSHPPATAVKPHIPSAQSPPRTPLRRV